MNSFDDLLNTEILNELGTGGMRDAIATKVTRAVTSMPDAVKAKAGSKAAKGRNNLRDMVQHLEDEFKVFCGEQSLRVQETAVEDFLEFLRHRVHFNITDENFDRLAYGPVQDAPHAKKIKELEELALKFIHDNKSPEFHILALANFAKSNDGDGVMARKALWSMARANPRLAKDFRKVTLYVGRPLGPMFKRLVQQIAQLIIKLGDRTNYASASKDGETAAAAQEPMNLDVGEQVVPNLIQIKAKKWQYAPLFDELEQYGLRRGLAQEIGVGLADKKLDTEAETDAYKAKLRSIKRENGINIARILMQAMRGGNRGSLQQYLVAKHKEFGKVVNNDLHGRGTRSTDENNKTVYKYDGSDFNKMLSKVIVDANTAQGVIVILLGCLGKELT